MEIERRHSDEQIKEETRLMLSRARRITLADLMRLYLAGSALVLGGVYDEAEEEKSEKVTGGGAEAWARVADEIEAAFRGLEIIVPSEHASKNAVDVFSPEWLMDIVSAAAHALNDSAYEVLHTYPLATVCHAVAAYHRGNGGITRRPLQTDSVLAALKVAREATVDGR